MKSRYHVQQDINVWLVLDRRKIRLHNDVVGTFKTRDEARKCAHDLNLEEHPETSATTQEEMRHD
jgi:hypothetical protein